MARRPMTDERVLAVCTDLLTQCANYPCNASQDSADIELALNYYFMRARGDEQEGRSKIVSGDVSAMVEAVLSQGLDALAVERLIEFPADNAEDANQVELEAIVVNDVLRQSGGYLLLLSGLKNAALLRNGVAKTWVEDLTKKRRREFRNVAVEAFAELATDRPGVKLDKINYANGTLTYSELSASKRVRASSVDIANFVYTENWPDFDLDTIPCCGERRVDTRSELVSTWGFDRDQVDELEAFVETDGASAARNPKGKTRSPARNRDKSLDLVEWYHLDVLIDLDRDGIAERRRVAMVPNRQLLANDPATRVCYNVGAIIVNPGRVRGISLYDKLKQTQDERTGTKRNIMDNSNAAIRPRTIFLEDRVDIDDLEDPRMNGNIAVRGNVADVRAALAMHVVPDLTPGLIANMAAIKADRSELGGAALDLATGQAQLTDRAGSQGIDRMYSVMEQLASTMTRTFAETFVRQLALNIHATLREYITGPVTYMRRGMYETTDPSKWPQRRDAIVKLGLSPGARARKVQGYATVLDAQLKLFDKGGNDILVTYENFYDAFMAWARANDVDLSERFLLDPKSDRSRAERKRRDDASAQQSTAQAKLMDAALGMERLRISLDKRAGDADRVLEYFKALLTSETKTAEVVGNATGAMELEHMRQTAQRMIANAPPDMKRGMMGEPTEATPAADDATG